MRYRNQRVEPYFSYLKNGQKNIDGRLREGWYCRVKPGDEIEVHNPEESGVVVVKVKKVTRYGTIREMLTQEPLSQILPGINTVDRGIEVYRGFYSPQREKRFGMIAMEVEVKEIIK